MGIRGFDTHYAYVDKSIMFIKAEIKQTKFNSFQTWFIVV
jgi:hypothetical protein